MRFHSPELLRVLRELCDEHGVLLIFDEIATGFGRTGELFAAEHAGVSPDVMCVGKALTGGYLTMAATLCTTRVAAGNQRRRGAGARARSDLHGQPAGRGGRERLDRAAARRTTGGERSGGSSPGCGPGWRRPPSCPGCSDVRVLGAIGVVQLDHEVDMAAATRAAVREGVWLRPFRDLVYTMPPYVTSDEDLARVCAAVVPLPKRDERAGTPRSAAMADPCWSPVPEPRSARP